MRILVLDDEPAIGRLIQRIASAGKFATEAVTEASVFQTRYRAAVPDLIILDLQIGTSDGIEQLRFLGAQGFRGGVILMSGFDARVLATAERLGRELGLDIAAAIAKPLRAETLSQLLDDLHTRLDPVSAPELLNALREGELFLEYQPIVVRGSAEVRQLEALVRWKHPRRGRMPPDRFIPMAEQATEIIDSLTDWIVAAATAEYGRLRDLGLAVSIAVNISAMNLDALDFPDRVSRVLQEAGVPAGHFCMELTETAAARHSTRSMDVLSRLRLKGVTLTLDDFGIGYSSLKQLRQLPFSALKIDRSFVADLGTSRDALAIVKSIADLARNMELECIAEGVETEETAALVESLGVTAMQGYLIARPLPASSLPAWIESWRAGGKG